MIDQTPPENMDTEERLDEIASLLNRACERLRNKSGKQSLCAYLTGLHRWAERPWEPKKAETIVSTRLPKYDDTLIKAVIRAHDWQGRIESGLVASVAELALKEGIGENYVGKIIRLTELAPDITMAILNGRQPPSMTLSQMEDVPLLWEEQRQAFGFAGQ